MNHYAFAGAAFAAITTGLVACETVDAGVESDEQALRLEPPDDGAGKPAGGAGSAGCVAWCDAAGEVGCPREGDCMASCDALIQESPGCRPELDTFFVCAARAPDADTCGVSQVGGVSCSDVIHEHPFEGIEEGCFGAYFEEVLFGAEG